MRSDLQNLASRANGCKSRGPVTEEGKLASSRNAVKHGLLCQNIVLHGENVEGFRELVARLYEELQPRSGVEEDLVDTMAVARWRQTRIWIIEKSSMELQMKREDDQARSANHNSATLAGLAFRALSDDSRTLDLINRYESRYDRQYLRAHRRLMQMRAEFNKSGIGSCPDPCPPPPACELEPEIIDSAKRTQDAPESGPAAISRGSSDSQPAFQRNPFTRKRNIGKAVALRVLGRKSIRGGHVFSRRRWY